MTSPPKDAVDAWARRELKVGPDATQLEVRQAALRLVAAAKFAPTFDDSVAIGVALGRPRDVVDAFQKEAYYSRDEEALRHAIENFAKAFFHLSPEVRTCRWRELDQWAVVFPWWRSRLETLKKGLSIEAPANESDPLSRQIAEMFVAPPGERAARCREAVDGLSDEQHDAAIEHIHREHPQLAELAGFGRASRHSSPSHLERSPRKPPPADANETRPWLPVSLFLLVMMSVRLLGNGGSSATSPKPPDWRPAAIEQKFEPAPFERLRDQDRPLDPNFDFLNRDRDINRRPDQAKPRLPVGLENLPDFKID